MKYKIVYTSATGNTRNLAFAIYQALEERSKDIEELAPSTSTEDGEIYLVGFWTDKGTCPLATGEFLKRLSGKKVLLFGTCGMGSDPEYYAGIEQRVKSLVPNDCEYLGTFLCQGKMPRMVREKYESMLENKKTKELAKKMIANFDQALLHPDAEDYQRAIAFVRRVCV
ncbi:MAG: flavodoxin family protein BilS [Lachnospiraceae bacterium]